MRQCRIGSYRRIRFYRPQKSSYREPHDDQIPLKINKFSNQLKLNNLVSNKTFSMAWVISPTVQRARAASTARANKLPSEPPAHSVIAFKHFSAFSWLRVALI